MNILIDIGHPAHVHYFKNMAWLLEKSGHRILFTVKDKEVAVQLLKAYNFNYLVLGKNHKGLPLKVLGLLIYTLRLYIECKKFRPEILFNASPSAAFVSWLLGKRHVALEDTFNMEQVKLYLPFTTLVLTGTYDHVYLGKKQICLPYYQELLYLHEKYFKPDSSIRKEMGLLENERYAVVRFISWNASHDHGHKGMSPDNKLSLIRSLASILRVFISSEVILPPELEDYRISISPERMHDVLFYAEIFVGESATMASECAILGTPSIYINNSHLGYLKEEAKMGLMHLYSESLVDQERAIKKAIDICKANINKKYYHDLLAPHLGTKIDVTALLVWLVEYYPTSFTMMNSPDFDYYQFG